MQSSIVQKLFSILTIASEARGPLTFSKFLVRSGLNKSSLHRILALATQEKLLQFDANQKTYLLGPKVFDLVRNAYRGYEVQEIAMDEMSYLHGKFDGNVTIGVPYGLEVVYLRILDAKGSMNSFQRPGMREPVHCSASGKALMAYLPDGVINSKLKLHNFEKFTERTIDNFEDYKKALTDVRANGYGTNDREEYDHLVGISAPVFNYMSEPVAVLNIWTVHKHHPIEEVLCWADELMASAARVTSKIGGTAPT